MKLNISALCRTLVLAFSIGLAMAPASFGKGASSSSRSTPTRSTSSFSKPATQKLYTKPPSAPPKVSSGGYTKPASQAPKPSSSAGFTKPPPRTTPTTATAKGNRFDKGITSSMQTTRAVESKQAFDESRNKFKPAPNLPSASRPEVRDSTKIKSNPVAKTTRVYSNVNYSDVNRRRSSYYGGWNPPVYAYGFAPSYGGFDSTFLMWALLHDQSYGYNHRNDAEYKAWREDANKLAEQNGELKAQLAAQDKRIDEMAAGNTPVNAAYVPAAFAKDPMTMLANEAIQQLPVEKATIRIATGVLGGRYYEVAKRIEAEANNKFKVELIPTAGSAENLKLMREGKVDAALVQSDTDFITKEVEKTGYVTSGEFHSATVYCEYVMLIVGNDSSITSVKDLKKGNTVYVGPQGSGTGTTWQGLVLQNAQYKDVAVINGSYEEALEKVKSDKNAAMLFVAGADAPILERAGRSGQFKLVPVDDPTLSVVTNDKDEPIYDSLIITNSAYPGLQKNGNLQTLSVDAVWIIDDKWINKFGSETFDLVNDAIMETIAAIHIQDLKAQAEQPAQAQTKPVGKTPWLWIILGVAAVGYALYYVLFKKQY